MGNFAGGDFADAVCAGLDAAQGLFDFVESILFLGEHRQREVAVVSIAAGIALMLAATGRLGAFWSLADGVTGHAGHRIHEFIAQV